MVSLKDAFKKAEKFRGSKICSAGDCGDKWIFGFIEDEPDILSAGKKLNKNDYSLKRESTQF